MGQGSYQGIGSMSYASSPTPDHNGGATSRGRKWQGGREKPIFIITGVLLLLIVVVAGWIILYTPKEEEIQYSVVGEWKNQDLKLGTLLVNAMSEEIKTQTTDAEMREDAGSLLKYLENLVNKVTSNLSLNFTEAGTIEIMNDDEAVEALSEVINLRYECQEGGKIKIVLEWHLSNLVGTVVEAVTGDVYIPYIVEKIINNVNIDLPFLTGEMEWLGDYRMGADWMLLKIEGRKWELFREYGAEGRTYIWDRNHIGESEV